MDRTSALLEYAGGRQTPMNADHLTVYKFTSKEDPNFELVVNVLRSMANKMTATDSSAPQSGGSKVNSPAFPKKTPSCPLSLEYNDRPMGRVLGQAAPEEEQLLDPDAEESERPTQYLR